MNHPNVQPVRSILLDDLKYTLYRRAVVSDAATLAAIDARIETLRARLAEVRP